MWTAQRRRATPLLPAPSAAGGEPWLRATFKQVEVVSSALTSQAEGLPIEVVTFVYERAKWRDLADGGGKDDDDDDD